jgi:hypothetical protein
MDRENLCHQCAEEGHKASGCRNRPYCLFCNLEGHISGGENCPKATIAQQEKADEERQGSAKSRDEVAIPMSHLIIAGDFNAKAHAWGSGEENPRGSALAEFVARLNLTVQNRGSEPTFVRGDSKSVIDVTLTARTRVSCWKVCSDWEVMSDHVPILFEVCQTKADPKGSDPGAVPVKGWIWEKNSEEKFANLLRAKVAGRNELSAEVLGMAITECVRARRILPRQARRGHIDPTEKENLQAIYQEARKDLKREIKAAKAKTFEKIRQEVEEDVWGKGYKIVIRKMVATIPPTESEEKAAVSTLFPQAPVNKWRKMGGEDGPNFSAEELIEAARKIREGKAAGPDGVGPEIVKAASSAAPQAVLGVMNGLLRARAFPGEWTRARLVLIPKGKASPDGTRKFRPICLLYSMGKLYEQLIKTRLTEELDEKGGLSDDQYSFRKGRSTSDAIKEV